MHEGEETGEKHGDEKEIVVQVRSGKFINDFVEVVES